MKIMIVTPYFAPKIGGMEKIAQQVAKRLHDTYGHDVFVVTSNHEAKERDEIVVDGLRVIRLPRTLVLSNTPIGLSWYKQLRHIIATEKPDLVNVHSPVPFMADVAARAAKREHTPYVVSYHAGSMLKKRSPANLLLWPYEAFLLPPLFNNARKVAAYFSAFINQKVKDPTKLFFVPPGVDTTLFKPAPKNSKPKRTQEVLFVGRIERTSAWKGVASLLEAMALVIKDVPNARVKLVGPGDAIEDFKAKAEALGIAEHVTFTGPLAGKALADAYRGARVHVLPSESDAESFGMVLIEAMACGTPTIGSQIGGIPNVIESTGGGLLTPPKNPPELARTIKKLLSDDALHDKLAAAGLASVLEKYTWDKSAETYNRNFMEALTPKTSVVHVSPYYPPHLGGMENVAQQLAVIQSVHGLAVQVYTSNTGYTQDYQDPEPLEGRVHRLRTTEIAGLPVIWSLLPKLLRTPRRSVFHVHIAQAFIPEIALLAARMRKSTFIAHFHLDVVASGRFGFLFTAYKKTLFPFMLRHADKVIVFSDEQKTLVTRAYGVRADRVAIIPNGVSVDAKAPPKQYVKDGTKLLFVGRLSPQKRVDLLVQAVSFLPKNVRLTIVGSGPEDAKLRKLVTELELKNITFRGALHGSDLAKVFKQADLFVVTSEREGMPLAVLEAMAAQLPVVAFDVLGVHELVKDVGVLVPGDDPRALAKTIQQTLASKSLRRLSRQSHTQATQFSWETISRHIEQLYKEGRRV